MMNVAISEQWDVVDHATGKVYLEAGTAKDAIEWVDGIAAGNFEFVELHSYETETGITVNVIFVK